MTSRTPRPGTRIRRMYDLLAAHKGRVINAPLTMFEGGTRHRNRAHEIEALRDQYGLDIRKLGQARWILAGEWSGRNYIDYTGGKNGARQDHRR